MAVAFEFGTSSSPAEGSPGNPVRAASPFRLAAEASIRDQLGKYEAQLREVSGSTRGSPGNPVRTPSPLRQVVEASIQDQLGKYESELREKLAARRAASLLSTDGVVSGYGPAAVAEQTATSEELAVAAPLTPRVCAVAEELIVAQAQALETELRKAGVPDGDVRAHVQRLQREQGAAVDVPAQSARPVNTRARTPPPAVAARARMGEFVPDDVRPAAPPASAGLLRRHGRDFETQIRTEAILRAREATARSAGTAVSASACPDPLYPHLRQAMRQQRQLEAEAQEGGGEPNAFVAMREKLARELDVNRQEAAAAAATRIQGSWRGHADRWPLREERLSCSLSRGGLDRQEAERQGQAAASRARLRDLESQLGDHRWRRMDLEQELERLARLRAELSALGRQEAHEREKLARLRMLQALGAEQRRCFQCDLDLVKLNALLRALYRVCAAAQGLRVKAPRAAGGPTRPRATQAAAQAAAREVSAALGAVRDLDPRIGDLVQGLPAELAA